MPTTTDSTALSTIMTTLLGLNTAFEASMTEIDTVELKIVQQQLIRIIERNGFSTCTAIDHTCTISPEPASYKPATSRELIFDTLQAMPDDACSCQAVPVTGLCPTCRFRLVVRNPLANELQLRLCLKALTADVQGVPQDPFALVD